MKLTFVVDMPDLEEDDALVIAGRLIAYLDISLDGSTAKWELLKVETQTTDNKVADE